MSRPGLHKRDREKAKRERAAEKAARREDRRSSTDTTAAPMSADEQAAVVAQLAELHRRFEAEEITFDDFDEARRTLTAQLEVN